jgi:CCR4-NOT complex subunit CAF16
MHAISDGQRRRVQIVLGLLEPWEVLLLDEVTVDLDVLVRQDLLRFLEKETRERGATIVYATHIFDGISDWATHIAHIAQKKLELKIVDSEFWKEASSASSDSKLLKIVEKWLRKDKEVEKSMPNQTNKTRWEVLSENMAKYGDKYYNYWT